MERVSREELDVGLEDNRRHGLRSSMVGMPQRSCGCCVSDRKEEANGGEFVVVSTTVPSLLDMILRKSGFQSLYVVKKSAMDDWASSIFCSDDDDEMLGEVP